MDESLVRLNASLVKCWMKRGQQKRIPLFTGTRQTQMLAGALNWQSGQVHVQPLAHLNSEELIPYFEWLLTTIYPTQTIVLVMDNASFHHSRSLQAFLACHDDRLVVFWLPPYSPDLNPIERFWKHLKEHCANYLYKSLQDLLEHIERLLHCQNIDGHDLQLKFSKN